MIIQSTTLDTEEKVKEIYGGSKWSKIEGRFLLGASSAYAVNSTGGEAKHKLTTNEMPSHYHCIPAPFASGSIRGVGSWNDSSMKPVDNQMFHTSSEGGGQAHNNMPPYKAVYIWERIE